jgi:hypothetical protein
MTHIEAALTVYDHDHTARQHDRATTLRSEILAALAAVTPQSTEYPESPPLNLLT